MSQLFVARLAAALACLAVATTSLAAPRARAQVRAPGATLLLIGRIAPDADPTLAGAVTDALHAVGRERGYTIVALGAPLSREVSLATGDGLTELVAQLGVERVLHVDIAREGTSYSLHLATAARDGSPAAASLRSAELTDVVAVLSSMARAIVPAPGTVLAGSWVAPPVRADASASASEVPPPPAVAGPPPAQTAPSPVAMAADPGGSGPPPRRARPDGGAVGLTIAGAVTLGAGWLVNGFFGAFAGYNSCTFSFSSCTSSYDPDWSPFRELSAVPVLGPWLQLGFAPHLDNLWPYWLVFDGLLQGTGLALLIAGIVGLSGDDEDTAPIAILPSVGPDRASLDILGRF